MIPKTHGLLWVAVPVIMVLAMAPDGQSQTRRPTISPASHDFGKAVLRVPTPIKVFVVRVPQGKAELVKVDITGPDAAEFKADATTGYLIPNSTAVAHPTDRVCRNFWESVDPNPPPPPPDNECTLGVVFTPRTVGPKSATLKITDPGGSVQTAELKGNGVAGCVYSVVPCNYASMYSGEVSWAWNNGDGASGQVKVTIANGVGVCAGSATFSGGHTDLIGGAALVAVEFKENELRDDRGDKLPKAYQITVACPPAGSSERADMRDAHYIDPVKATDIPQSSLMGEQTVNGETTKWNLTRQF